VFRNPPRAVPIRRIERSEGQVPPPISTTRTEEAPFCTSSAPCEGACEGLPLERGTGIGLDRRLFWGLPRFWGKSDGANPRRAGLLEISTGKRPYLVSWCPKRQQNTRCCGFLLTRTTDSGIFSSAAINGLLRETAQSERFQSSGAHLSAWQEGIRGDECSLAGSSRAKVTRRMPEAPAGRSRDLRDAAFF
jgi:hypothetical protein